MENVKFRGTPIYLDGKTYILPPVSVGQFEEYQAELKRRKEAGIESNTSADDIALILKAFNRNYPEITLEWLRDALDVATLREAAEAIGKMSGLVAVAPGE